MDNKLANMEQKLKETWENHKVIHNNLVEKLSYFVEDFKEESFFPFKYDKKAELHKIEIRNEFLIGELLRFYGKLLMEDPELTQLQEDTTQFCNKAYDIWATKLAEVINSNPVGFDGSAHFSNKHPINPTLPLLEYYSNDVGIVDLDENGLATVLYSLLSAPDLDGSIDANRVKKIAIVIPTPTLYNKALAAIESIKISNGSNQTWYSFEPILLPQLVTSDIATQKRWYLMNVTSTLKRAFVTSVVQHPMLKTITGASPNDYSRLKNDSIRMSWTAKGGVGTGLPREVVRAIAP